jgi:hypothetical protein
VNNQKIDFRIKVKKIEDLIDLPITVVVNKFDEIASKDFRKQFQDALNTGQDVVPVIIDSYGGQAYSENVGKPPNYFIDLVHEKGHADWYLDANECIKHNLANHIRTPRFNINIDVNISFGK